MIQDSPADDGFDAYSTVRLHNVRALSDPSWTDGGDRLDRVPPAVANELNVAARGRVRHPAGCEVRFVPEAGETVTVTLSAAAESVVRPFWGAFQGQEPIEVGPDPEPIELSVPDPIRSFDHDAGDAGPFDPRVCRLRFEPWAPAAIHAVEGACRPPRTGEVPGRRYLAYGTSITEGAAASAAHLTYVARAARQVGLDPLNLGMSGSAFCEPVVADHVAAREDWDVATLALSVNMANRGFTVEQFRERAEYLIETVASGAPDRPVVGVSLYPYHADLRTDGDRERARAFRDALTAVVENCDEGRVTLVDGRDVMPASGLTTDLLHPGDAGMEAIGSGIASALGNVLE